ncbi:probable calcium-binding protein CML41 isoform X2 [Prosopis cineraria]|uniref:probable calcium-binding protein CML41 isoform X2 n=1 Tax=Prosopis cineraria TaxID=364024 RepID=UPI00240EA499|nr:probable calcium-binding protein CML41 isoform X2 [Prosopis cineraria]XP_054808803.1 probable calcium-binding protein CML41 isoform X2 [Prosopis cineraria]
MASAKWFSNTSLRLSLGRSKSKPARSRSSNSLTSPTSSSSSTPKPVTREDELREVFRRFDGNGDGKISALELRSYFGSIGEYLSHEEAEGVIRDLDSDGDSLLDMEDFMKLMKKEEGDEDLKKAFEMFEWEKGSGCITPKSLQRMLHRLGDDKSYDECEAMIHAFDVDRNGVLDFSPLLELKQSGD